MKRIQKKFQGTIPENKILNMFSESLTDTYSCNKINELVNSASGGVGVEQDPTVPDYVKNITEEQIAKWDSSNSGVTDYQELNNKPKINNIELSGDKTLDDLGIQPKGEYITSETDPVFVASPAYTITQEDIEKWNNPQEVPGSSISYNVGDVVITTSNVGKDEMSNRFGGEWELFDKEFSPKVAQGALSKSSSTSEETGWWSRSGHTIQIDLRWKNSKQLNDDTVTVGTLNYATLGVDKEIPMTQHYLGYTDGGECALFVEVGNTGTVYVVDVIPDAYVSTGSSNFVTIVLMCPPDYMLDSACDKFYWRKLA